MIFDDEFEDYEPDIDCEEMSDEDKELEEYEKTLDDLRRNPL
jgi:hypothetical protein